MRLLLLTLLFCMPSVMIAQWNKSATTPIVGLNKIDFPALNAVYAIGDLGKLYKSTDAGISWEEQYDFGPFSSINEVCFINADTGFVSTIMGQQITFDGGVNWSILSHFDKLKLCNDMLYASYVSNDTVYIQTSEDIGSTWNIVYQHYEANAQPFQVSMLNTDSAFFINPNKLEQVYKTTNGFSTIDTINIFTGPITLQNELDFKDMNNGFLYGNWGGSSHPTKAWNNLINLDGFGVLPVLDLAFTSNKLYAASLYGKIFVSFNNGNTWDEQVVANDGPIYSVAFLNDSIGVAIGDGFYYTTNGGVSTSVTYPHLITQIKIFPNPSSQYIQISYPNNIKIKTLQIIDAAGKRIKDFSKEEKLLNISGISKGIYFLQIRTNAGNKMEKIIIQ